MASNAEKIRRINEWQDCKTVHPLTCGNDSNHSNLRPEEKGGDVILICPDCNYVQHWVPGVVFDGPPGLPPGWPPKIKDEEDDPAV